MVAFPLRTLSDCHIRYSYMCLALGSHFQVHTKPLHASNTCVIYDIFFAIMSKDQCDDLWPDPICHYYTEGTTDSSIGILRCALDDICV